MMDRDAPPPELGFLDDADHRRIMVENAGHRGERQRADAGLEAVADDLVGFDKRKAHMVALGAQIAAERGKLRSEENTSELQSLMRSSYAGFCLKKNNRK